MLKKKSKPFICVYVRKQIYSSKGLDFIRHHFAYANLNRWSEDGKDVNVMLAFLMRYMWHANIQSTLYYYDKEVLMASLS